MPEPTFEQDLHINSAMQSDEVLNGTIHCYVDGCGVLHFECRFAPDQRGREGHLVVKGELPPTLGGLRPYISDSARAKLAEWGYGDFVARLEGPQGSHRMGVVKRKNSRDKGAK